jgi:hypothetical protein
MASSISTERSDSRSNRVNRDLVSINQLSLHFLDSLPGNCDMVGILLQFNELSKTSYRFTLLLQAILT